MTKIKPTYNKELPQFNKNRKCMLCGNILNYRSRFTVLKMCRLAHPICLSIYNMSKEYTPAYYRMLRENNFISESGEPLGNFPKVKKMAVMGKK